MYILLAILLLAILITVHEFGHFLAARAMKIEVREFAIGMGPKLIGWKSRKYETAFSVRAIPIGGYCAFYGEDDPTGKSKDDPRAFPKQNVWKRLFVILMGPMMNFVLALYSAGMQAGDRVTEINGKNMLDGTMDTLLDTLQDWKAGDEPLQMTVKRGDETLHMEMSPVWDETEKKMRRSITERPKQVSAVLKDVEGAPVRSVVAGDFNDTPLSYTYFRLLHGRKDSFVRGGHAFGSTYSVLWPWLRIDYILYPQDLAVVSYEVERVRYSDHYPIIATYYETGRDSQ